MVPRGRPGPGPARRAAARRRILDPCARRATLREPAPDLTASQAEELHAELVALRDELARVVAGFRDAAKPVDLEEPIGRVSRIDAIQQQQMARASREGLARRAAQVASALDRVAEGTYGACVACEENVGYARLKARPETPLCIACQSRRER